MSWKHPYRQLVASVLPVLEHHGVTIIPPVVHLLGYENKVLMKQVVVSLDLSSPRSFSVATWEGFEEAADHLGYPFVIKEPEGFASSSVRLIRSELENESCRARYFTETDRGTRGLGTIVMEEFLPGLAGDWKVIVIGDVAASLWRGVRPNDFRASGSGVFEFRKAPDEILNFAHDVTRKLDIPWASLDIAEPIGPPQLLEYQAVHFGTTATDKTPAHFARSSDGRWVVRQGAVPMEREMVFSALNWIYTRAV